MATIQNSSTGAHSSGKSLSCVKINDNAFTMDDVKAVIQERQDMIDMQHQQNELEKKKQLLVKAAEAAPKKNVKVSAASAADILGFDPRKRTEASFCEKPIDEIPVKFQKYYKLLIELRSKCKSGVCKLANANLNISTADEKRDTKVDRSTTDVDSFDTSFALGLLKSEQEALVEIDAAIKRIYDGSYGICEATGKPIEQARLLAVPFTRYSIEGKMAQEQVVKTRDRSDDGSIFASEIEDDTPSDYSNNYDE